MLDYCKRQAANDGKIIVDGLDASGILPTYLGYRETPRNSLLLSNPSSEIGARLSPEPSYVANVKFVGSPSPTIETTTYTMDAYGGEEDPDIIIVQHLLASLHDCRNSSRSLFLN